MVDTPLCRIDDELMSIPDIDVYSIELNVFSEYIASDLFCVKIS